MPSERRPRQRAGLRRATVSLLGLALLCAATVAKAGILLGDTNCDGRVNQADFDALVAVLFGGESDCAGLDVNGDSVISAGDVVALLPLLPAPEATFTPTATPITPTPISTATATSSPSVTLTPSLTATTTITITPGGPTLTPSSTGTVTGTPTSTKRPTRTETGTETPTVTRTPTRTRTQTGTRTPTDTPSPGRTRSTRTETPTDTPSPTLGTPGAPSVTATPTPTTTGSPQATSTPSVTSTPSNTRRPTVTPTDTRTQTVTRTPSITVTPSLTRTPSWTVTASRTATATRTATFTPVPTNTRTQTVTRTVTLTRTPTLTPTVTATGTSTRTPTPTVPRPFGPEVVYFGIADASNRVLTPIDQTDDGVPIFSFPNDFGFIIVVEGRQGTSNRDLSKCGTVGVGLCSDGRSAVQILADRKLGNGSAAVCDVAGLPHPGGVPAVPSLMFGSSQMVSDAINDLACRFDTHPTSDTACTFDALGNYSFVRTGVGDNVKTTLQYCSAPVVGSELTFSQGLTRLKVQLEDVAGNVGNQVEIAVQVP